ncbi:MAG: NAD(P)(+) transhydrogenase (Re/Si-specific) subunit beta [Pseudomonadaceae bacterium]|nr:NAD(P)(+) transhydrogenase (Re/Si-specific) subunit beta [Pseudomonadaceae bacterium]
MTLSPDLSALLALLAGLLFIMGLKGLAHPKTARRGNSYAMAGMALAIVITLLQAGVTDYITIAAGLALGAVVGVPIARGIQLTSLPQLVAAFHSFVGLAAALVAAGMYLQHYAFGLLETRETIEMSAGAAIGMVTFSGSILAALKLQGWVSGRPWTWGGRHVLNLLLLLAIVACAVAFVTTFSPWPFVALIVLATIFGYTLVAPIGGADMPVIVSMLNSYSGWAAAATGFMLEQPLLVLTGAIIGMSGAILSYIMCAAMNRSFISVIMGGFGAEVAADVPAAADGKVAKQAGVEDAAFMLDTAERIIIVPGYGMAVAQAQHAVKELFNTLTEQGKEVSFAIHPVAGRMPGHMNVLLAEADIPYDAVHELEEINPEFARSDVVLIFGANDVVNPAAQTTPGSPIYGMPVLEAWKAKQVYVVKRSHRPGYAGVDNPLFTMDNAALLLGDAKDVAEKLTQAVKEG